MEGVNTVKRLCFHKYNRISKNVAFFVLCYLKYSRMNLHFLGPPVFLPPSLIYGSLFSIIWPSLQGRENGLSTCFICNISGFRRFPLSRPTRSAPNEQLRHVSNLPKVRTFSASLSQGGDEQAQLPPSTFGPPGPTPGKPSIVPVRWQIRSAATFCPGHGRLPKPSRIVVEIDHYILIRHSCQV